MLFATQIINVDYIIDWSNETVVAFVLKKFVETIGTDPRKLTKKHFNENMLGGLLGKLQGSVYLALLKAGYAYSPEETLEHTRTGEFQTEKIYPWERRRTSGVYDLNKKENRVAAIKWLVWKLKGIKNPEEFTNGDFRNNGLRGIVERNGNSARRTLMKAGVLEEESVPRVQEQPSAGIAANQ